MWDYFKPQEFIIERITFYSQGSRYNGDGVLTWDPEDGFNIVAKVERKEPIPEKVEYRSINVVSRPGCVRMVLNNGLKAFIPVGNTDDLRPLVSNKFSQRSRRMIFLRENLRVIAPDKWHGHVLFETASKVLLPDQVTDETRIAGELYSQGLWSSGVFHSDDSGFRIIGQRRDNNLEMDWSLPKNTWDKNDSRNYSQGLQYAFSFFFGEKISMLYHEHNRGNRRFTDVRRRSEPLKISLFNRPFIYDQIDKNLLLVLTNFFAQSNNYSYVAKKILDQMIEASQQQTMAAHELLVATILEAALRTIYDQPFDPEFGKKNDPFNVSKYLKKFRNDFLSQNVEIGRKWKKFQTPLYEAQKRLRDRNAHLDWIETSRGKLSEEYLKQAVNDMIFLSHFYGYMILALAGIEKLEPKFPEPFSQWSPLFTVSRIQKKDD